MSQVAMPAKPAYRTTHLFTQANPSGAALASVGECRLEPDPQPVPPDAGRWALVQTSVLDFDHGGVLFVWTWGPPPLRRLLNRRPSHLSVSRALRPPLRPRAMTRRSGIMR